MAVVGVAASLVGVAPPAQGFVASEATLRSSTAALGGGSSGCEGYHLSFASAASQFCGQRYGNSSLCHQSSTRASCSGARAYAATQDQTRERTSARSGGVSKTLYESLGVSKGATAKEIKAAYRQAARKLHPDVVPADQRQESTKAFLHVQDAYSTLSDERSRQAYDYTLSVQSFQATGFGSRGAVTPSWGFTTAPISSPQYPTASSFSFKGRSWETDQCW